MMKSVKIVFVICCLLQMFTYDLYAQEQPPRPISVYVSPVQGLSFGAIILGTSGGTVTVSPNGSRSSTGGVFLGDFGFSYSPALFEIEANPGTLISIMNGPDVTLTGSNGGTMTLKLGNSEPASPFVTTTQYPTRTLLRIGGTLEVGSALANPAGSYNGTFSITLIQE
jgi:uncharacterized protein DUF4402